MHLDLIRQAALRRLGACILALGGAPLAFMLVRAGGVALGLWPRPELFVEEAAHRVWQTLRAELLPEPTRGLLFRYADSRGARERAAPRDLDLTASTDAEDGAAFVADLFEFAGQGQVLALDALGDVLALGAFGGAAAALARLGSWRMRRR